MDVNNVTIGQLKELQAFLSPQQVESSKAKNPHIGKFCIIRCYNAGVHAGTVMAVDGPSVELTEARRLRFWRTKEIDGKQGVSLSELALHGLGEDCRINETVPEITVLDACEIIPCSEEAAKSIKDYKVYLV